MASTLFRGPVLVGKKNEAGKTGFNITQKDSNYTVVISILILEKPFYQTLRM